MKILFLIIALVSAFISGALRFADFLIYFDESSGFFTDNALLSYIGLSVILIFAVAGGLIFTKRVSRSGEYKEKKNIPMALVSVFAGASFIYAGFEIYSEYQRMVNRDIIETTSMGFSMRTPFMVLTFIFGLYLVFSGVLDFLGKSKYVYEKLPLLPIIPVIWSIVFTLFLFMHYSVSPLHTENAYVIFSAVLASYSLLQYAGFISKLDVKRLRRLIVSSSAFVSIALAYAFSSVFKFFYNIEAKGDVPFYVVILTLSLGVFMLFFILTMSFTEDVKVKNKSYRAKRYRKG